MRSTLSTFAVLTIAFTAMLTVAACSADRPLLGVSGTPTATAASSSTQNTPNKQYPLDIQELQQNPCSAMTSSLLHQLGISVQGKFGQDITGPSCTWNDAKGPTGVNFGVRLTNGPGNLSDIEARKSQFGSFQTTTVNGYQAAIAYPQALDPSEGPDGSCYIYVAASNQVTLQIDVQMTAGAPNYKNPCGVATVVAQAMTFGHAPGTTPAGGSPTTLPLSSPSAITQPLDPGKLGLNPCALLTNAQLQQLGITATGKAENSSTITGPACDWSDFSGQLGGTVSITVAPEVKSSSNGLADEYNAYARHLAAYFQPSAVNGYPAAFINDSADLGLLRRCTLDVGIADQTSLQFAVSMDIPNGSHYRDPCGFAFLIAQAGVSTAQGISG